MDSHRKILTLVTSISMVLSSLTVLRRVYYRWNLKQQGQQSQQKRLKLDDWLIITALVGLRCSGNT
jgi:hypothetical protein